MTTPGNEQWEHPPFMPVAPYDQSHSAQQSAPNITENPSTHNPQKWYRRPWVVLSGVVIAGVAGYSLNGPHSENTGPVMTPPASAAPFETPSPSPTSSPEPTRTVTVTASPSHPASPKPTAKETGSSDDFIFTPSGDEGGTLSGPAATWDEGYRNVIRFTCKNSIATAVLSVNNERGKAIKTYDKTELAGPLFRLCVGDTVSENVSEQPEAYHRAALASIIVKNNIKI